MEIMKQNLRGIAKIFGYKYDISFFSYLKSISKPNSQVCNKRVSGQRGYKCYDCEIDSNSLICKDCFEKSKKKHEGHNIIYNEKSEGFCDCGDPNAIIPEAFCPDHKGPFTNTKDLLNFIRNSFDEKILKNIDSFLKNIFELLIEAIKTVSNMNSDNEEYKNKEDELFKMINELILFVGTLYDTNSTLFYFVVLKFTENYPLETNHKCFNYDEEKKLISTIDENPLEKHKCICPFFQIIINLLMKRKTYFNIDNFFTLFIQNYKNKLITSLSFMHSFIKLYSNDNLKSFRSLCYQIIGNDLSEVIHEEKNISFLENFYSEIYIKIKELFELKSYEKANEIILKLFEIFRNLVTLQTIDKIRSNLNIYNILIDIICLINNLNTFENKINFDKFQREGFLPELHNCECYFLFIAELISHLINFNDLNVVKFIFNKIIEKLFEYKKYKESLKEKTFSHYIDYIRYYSIFLNRFCFNYSINNNCDLLDSFCYFQSLFPETKKLNTFLFKELIILFGFVISRIFQFFKYYGKNMILYYNNYFCRKIFIYCDITLMKYLLTTSEIQNVFNIKDILAYSNIDSSNDFFINLLESNFDEKNELLTSNIIKEKFNFKYICLFLEFILQIVRNNFSMIKLAFRYSLNFRMKYNDILLDNLLQKEKINFENIIKNEIIHYILENNNVIKKENCMEMYKNYSCLNKKLDINLVDDLFKEKCEI